MVYHVRGAMAMKAIASRCGCIRVVVWESGDTMNYTFDHSKQLVMLGHGDAKLDNPTFREESFS